MMKLSKIGKIVANHRGEAGATISILEDIQAIQGYLTEEVLRKVADETGTSIIDIYAIVSTCHRFMVGYRDPAGMGRASPDLPHAGIRCHACNHDLLDTRWLIDGRPCVKLTVAFGIEHGWFRLSSRPDTCLFVSEHVLPVEGVADFFCPHCHSQLFSSGACSECGAPMVPKLSSTSRLVPTCSSPRERCSRGWIAGQATRRSRAQVPREKDRSTSPVAVTEANANDGSMP